MVGVQVLFGALIMPLNTMRRSKRGSPESDSPDSVSPVAPDS
ncbi:hypothetical protein [Streptomyces chattanoogensis]